MNSRLVLGAVAICGLAFGGISNAAGYSGEATLAEPVAAPSETVIDGITWRCEDVKCAGRSHRSQVDSQLRECRKLVAALGAVTAFRSRGRSLSTKALAECNGLAEEQST